MTDGEYTQTPTPTPAENPDYDRDFLDQIASKLHLDMLGHDGATVSGRHRIAHVISAHPAFHLVLLHSGDVKWVEREVET